MISKPLRNLRSYGLVEGGNILLLPGLALLIAPPATGTQLLVMVLAIASCSGFLLVGSIYWLGLDKRLKLRDKSLLLRALSWADRLERPLLITTTAAALTVLCSTLARGVERSVVAAAVLTFLGVLEYLNYYQWQLQHFDNRNDIRRFLRGKGWRVSHMRRHLAIYRRGRCGGRTPQISRL